MDMTMPFQPAKSRTVLATLAALWATGVALYLLFAPTYETSVSTYSHNSPASDNQVRGYATLLDVNGPEILVVLTIPILLALSPLVFRKHQRAALLGAGALMLGFCILGALSVGTLYLPAALLLLLGAATKPSDSAIVVAVLCLACGSDDVELRVRVIVPAEIPTVSSGVLRMSLWAYDPHLADAPASLVDAASAFFGHTNGVQSEVSMSVQGKVPSGARHYISVRGFEVLPSGERYILWDGIEGTAAPTTVVMRPVEPLQ